MLSLIHQLTRPPISFEFFFYCYGDHRDLHSFPTRRSSDLSGHSDRVFLGTPVAIRIRSRCFGSRPGAQLGLGKLPSCKTRLRTLEANHAVFDAARKIPAVIPDMITYLQHKISWKGGLD